MNQTIYALTFALLKAFESETKMNCLVVYELDKQRQLDYRDSVDERPPGWPYESIPTIFR